MKNACFVDRNIASVKNRIVEPQKIKIELSYDQQSNFWIFIQKKSKQSRRDIGTLIFIAALFTIAKR